MAERPQYDPNTLVASWYDQYHEGIYSYLRMLLANQADADDAFQATFAGLLRLDGELGAVRHPKAYLYRAARNAEISLMRKNRAAPMGGDALEGLAAPAPAVSQEVTAMLEWALSRLPPIQREVIMLKVYDQMTFREIARVTGMLLPTAASHYWRGRRALRQLLGDNYEHPQS